MDLVFLALATQVLFFHSLTMPILTMHLIGNSTCLKGAIQDHHDPIVFIWYVKRVKMVEQVPKMQLLKNLHVSHGNIRSYIILFF